MAIMHKYVRRIKAKNEILQHGYSDFKGQFDPHEFEQIEGELPDNYIYINHSDLILGEQGVRSKTLLDKMKGLFGGK